MKDLRWVKWTLFFAAGIVAATWLGSRFRQPASLVLRLPLTHNFLPQPIDTDVVRSLRVYAVQYPILRDSLADACAAFRRDSAALAGRQVRRGVGQLWRDRWDDMNAALARRLEELRPVLITDSAPVSAGGVVTIPAPTGSCFLVGSRVGFVAQVGVAPCRGVGDEILPLGAICSR